MRLIDAEKYPCTNCGTKYCFQSCNRFSKWLYTAVDAVPVVHAKYDAGGDCTNCGYPIPTDDRCDAIFPGEIKFCYNCGAKMDGDSV